MNYYIIYTTNLTNSLVFYRALFNRMPDLIQPERFTYKTIDFILLIAESANKVEKEGKLKYEVYDPDELAEINNRMSRFMGIGRILNDCEIINDAIGLIDPDGMKWIVGNPVSKVHFKKCYLNSKLLNTYKNGTV